MPGQCEGAPVAAHPMTHGLGLESEACVLLQKGRVVPEDKAFTMGPRLTVCSAAQVRKALECLEDPVAHGIVQQVSQLSYGGA